MLDVLLDNALEHGAGPVTVRVGQDTRFATITVEDTGDGIAPHATERIFERGASRTNSTGIGLPLARALARADGGSLRVTRTSPTRFELRLRRAGDASGSG